MDSGCSIENNVPRALIGRARGQSVLAGARDPVLKKLPPRNSEERSEGGCDSGARHHSPKRHSSESALVTMT